MASLGMNCGKQQPVWHVRHLPRYNRCMLFFLIGDIQSGKTRWLERVLGALRASGVGVAGVLAPGVWLDHGPDAQPRFEKLGIDNVLLPQGERIPFARRRDLAERDGGFDEHSQAAQAQLGWAIDDDAIDRVNAHFDELGRSARDADAFDENAPSLLVVDELGRLELLRGEGLVAAMRLLDAGASSTFPHALAIVRADLVELARERFADAPWDGMGIIYADDEGEQALRSAFGL